LLVTHKQDRQCSACCCARRARTACTRRTTRHRPTHAHARTMPTCAVRRYGQPGLCSQRCTVACVLCAHTAALYCTECRVRAAVVHRSGLPLDTYSTPYSSTALQQRRAAYMYIYVATPHPHNRSSPRPTVWGDERLGLLVEPRCCFGLVVAIVVKIRSGSHLPSRSQRVGKADSLRTSALVNLTTPKAQEALSEGFLGLRRRKVNEALYVRHRPYRP